MLDRYIAETHYKTELIEASLEGAISSDEAFFRAVEDGLWNLTLDDELDGLEKDLEEMKTKLCGLIFKPQEKALTKKMIEKAKARQQELMGKKFFYESTTREYVAATAKYSYLIASCSYKDGVLLKDELLKDGFFLQNLVNTLNSDSISEEEYRELARTEPWRLYWVLGKEQGLFGKPTTEFSDEQRILCFWSKIYDSVYESMDTPSDEIIEDDDALDGWLILQKRKRDKEKGQSEAEKLAAKHGKAQEIFVVTDAEGAKKVAALNDSQGDMIRKKRMKLIQDRGEVNELEMPDTRNRLLMEAQNKFRNTITGKG